MGLVGPRVLYSLRAEIGKSKGYMYCGVERARSFCRASFFKVTLTDKELIDNDN